ncbi:MAG: hypothetical protein JXB15_13635, partial [Anaerolineales bacterium]|nr:hypothetical protein [Anaerolineales bacterium]
LEHELVENAEPNAFSLNEDASRLLIQSLIVPPGTPLPSRPAISPDLLQKTRSELGPNIIIKPQRRRMLEAIRPQMQIVQIEAKGIKLTRRSIELPQNIIRIIGSSDEDINRRIRADWKVFSGDTQRELGRLETQIKNALANIKADHLVHLRRDEYGLLQGDREAFTQAWNTFQTTIVEQFRSELRERVSGMIQQSQEVLLHLLKEHVNDGTLQIPRQRTLFPVSEEELTNYHLQQFIKRIKWPTPDTITSSIDVKCRFYDISEQMLGDPEFLQALEQHFGKLEEWFEMYEQMATPQAPETFGFSMN